jgi:hypothetical protein
MGIGLTERFMKPCYQDFRASGGYGESSLHRHGRRWRTSRGDKVSPAHNQELWVAQDDRQRRAGAGAGRLASAHIEELSAALPGFAEAMDWPG